MRVPLTGGSVALGAVLRPTPGSGAHAAGRSGGKGASSSRDAGRVLTLSGGDAASVSCGIAATREHDMTEQRSFKRLVRARMEKTGESYTAARATILKGADEPDPGEKRLLIVPDASIRERTGRGWEEWFDLLDEWGAADRSHRDIAKWVAFQLSIEPLGWNAQAITGSYERARRGREVGQMPDGFRVTASKTVAVPVDQLYEAFVDPIERKRWLPDIELRERTATKPKFARFDWGRERAAGCTEARREGSPEKHGVPRRTNAFRHRRTRSDEGVLARTNRRPQEGVGTM